VNPEQAVGSKKMVSIPKKATTVILFRERSSETFEVFLLKRHEKSSFMGGNYVYPGGRVDRGDGCQEICSLSKGVTAAEAHQTLGGSIPPEESLAHWIAGIRELFEESGILLAYDQSGNLFCPKDSSEQERFSNRRSLLQKAELTFCQLAQEEKLSLALDQLHYYAHWITPEVQPQRFDTRFFLARHPIGQEASHDQKETTAGLWLTPQEALANNLQGEVALSPPTLKTLEDLSRFKSISELFDSLGKTEIRPVLPILMKLPEEPFILFPWDPEYDMFQRGEVPNPIDHGRPSYPEDNTTRVVFKEGRWFPFCSSRSLSKTL
jgi:8-oxo-dGTP pyrophosphatase MutT (NUDIX family)